MQRQVFILGLIILSTVIPPVFGQDYSEKLQQCYAKAISGDVRPTLAYLNSLVDSELTSSVDLRYRGAISLEALVSDYRNRFVTAEEDFEFEDPFISELHKHYTSYWRTSLLNPKDEKKASKKLFRNLRRLVDSEGEKVPRSSNSRLESIIIKIAHGKGYHLKLGRVTPLRELMIWKKQERVPYEVTLPDESFSVEMVFIQNFLCRGWLGFATFDQKHTGGWATNEEIYRVGTEPKKDDEWFRVSLVGHEGRHVSDKRKYGSQPGWKLEYRAKLTELILAEKRFWELVNFFKKEAKENPKTAHPHASFLLIRGLLEHFGEPVTPRNYSEFQFEKYSIEELKAAAEMLLEKSTLSLNSKLK